jgi:hypothetical protein
MCAALINVILPGELFTGYITMPTSRYPAFFASAPVITVRDPLAAFLGAASAGVIEYRYEDAVRLAGHSCPTVASAFLMTRAALEALYEDSLPERGAICVSMKESRDAGVAGVIASVATLITGATEDSGFRGLGGQFSRRNLLAFDQPLAHGSLCFSRRDNRCSIEVSADLSSVEADSRMGPLMSLALAGSASEDQQQLFQELWQDRVRRILLDHADDAGVIKLTKLTNC